MSDFAAIQTFAGPPFQSVPASVFRWHLRADHLRRLPLERVAQFAEPKLAGDRQDVLQATGAGKQLQPTRIT